MKRLAWSAVLTVPAVALGIGLVAEAWWPPSGHVPPLTSVGAALGAVLLFATAPIQLLIAAWPGQRAERTVRAWLYVLAGISTVALLYVIDYILGWTNGTWL